MLRFFLGNIFICQRPCTSAAGDADSEEEEVEEENGSNAAGVLYKIGIKMLVFFFLSQCWSVDRSCIYRCLQGIWVM